MFTPQQFDFSATQSWGSGNPPTRPRRLKILKNVSILDWKTDIAFFQPEETCFEVLVVKTYFVALFFQWGVSLGTGDFPDPGFFSLFFFFLFFLLNRPGKKLIFPLIFRFLLLFQFFLSGGSVWGFSGSRFLVCFFFSFFCVFCFCFFSACPILLFFC